MKRIWMMLISSLLLCGLLTACGGDSAPAEDAPPEEEAPKVISVAERGTAVSVMTAGEWESQYPDIYASYMANAENESVHDYVEDYPMLSKVYEGMAFNKYYSSARGHLYTVEDVTSTGRPHALANCFSCKTPQYSAMVNESNGAAYSIPFEEAAAKITEPISCYSCHANEPGEFTISNLATMDPDAILDFYNRTIVDGQPFSDYTNPRTGVRQLKVQHPEFETFMGEGSQHKNDFTCADCHMPELTNEAGETYISHKWVSPLESQELIDSTCASCHADLKAEVRAIQTAMERRTYAIGYLLEGLTDTLAEAVESGAYTEDQLNQIRELARSAQFYWDFVFVENSEGAHNSKLDTRCLDKAEDFANQALALLH